MEFRHLRSFTAVVEAGSLLKASARLHLAQPALGQQIAALERELGTRLFDRSSRGMQLTEAGRAFLEHAKLILGDIERARAAVQASVEAPRGTVAIGLPTTIALAATLPLVMACRARLPEVKLKVAEAYSGFVREWLQAGRLDLAILYGDHAEPALAKQALLDERLALVTSPAGRPARSRVRLDQVAALPLVLPGQEHGLRRIIDEACHRRGLALQVIVEIDSLPSVKRAVAAGVGCTVLPLAAVAQEVAAGELHAATISDPGMVRRVVLATNVARPATHAASAVADLATGLIRDMLASGAWPGRWVGPKARQGP